MEQKIDAIILAKGAPVQTSDGSVTMCAIALSEELGLIRIYPLSADENRNIKVWSIVSITAKRSSKDNRRESWRVLECEKTGQIESSGSKQDILESCVLKSGTIDPIVYQNERRGSICVVKSSGVVGFALTPRSSDDLCAFDEDECWVRTQKTFPLKPYLHWTSIQGSEHKTHIVAQEVYMGMLHNASCPGRVFENMRVGDPDYEHWLILGNTKDRRTVWVAPHVHRLKKTGSHTHTNLLMFDGRKEGWPYLQQEDRNAKDAGPQLTFAFITEDI